MACVCVCVCVCFSIDITVCVRIRLFWFVSASGRVVSTNPNLNPSSQLPRQAFPYCKCSRKSSNTPLKLSLSSMEVAKPGSNSGNTYCFSIGLQPTTNDGSACHNMDLKKIEFSIGALFYSVHLCVSSEWARGSS